MVLLVFQSYNNLALASFSHSAGVLHIAMWLCSYSVSSSFPFIPKPISSISHAPCVTLLLLSFFTLLSTMYVCLYLNVTFDKTFNYVCWCSSSVERGGRHRWPQTVMETNVTCYQWLTTLNHQEPRVRKLYRAAESTQCLQWMDTYTCI